MSLLFVAILGGLIVGSFLNVCIYRIPDEASVVHPPSHCLNCGENIAWRDNVPLLSYLLLRGRCRSCAGAIPLRYPLVEAMTAALFAALLYLELDPRTYLVYAGFGSAMIVVTFIDIDHLIIPDVISLPAILVAPGVAWVVGQVTLLDSLLGIVLGGGFLWGFAWIYERLRHQEGMGFGDVKLLAMIGGFLGWAGALFSIVGGAVVGSAIGIVAVIARRGRMDSEIPFGPFLAGGAVVYMLAGPQIIAWYLRLPRLF